MTTYKKGNLRADKVKHDDGTSCCLWYPFPGAEGEEEDSGICFDFYYEDIDDMIALLQELKTVEPDVFVKDEEKEEE